MEDLFANFDIEIKDGSLKDSALVPDDGKEMVVMFKPKDNKIDLIDDMATERDFGFLVGVKDKGIITEIGVASSYNDEFTVLLSALLQPVEDNNFVIVNLIYNVGGEQRVYPFKSPMFIYKNNACGLFRKQTSLGIKINDMLIPVHTYATDIVYEDAFYYIKTSKPIISAYMGKMSHKSIRFANDIVLKPNYYIKDENE